MGFCINNDIMLFLSHNLFHYAKFFKNIRESIVQGTFSLKAEQFFKVYGDEYKQEKKIPEDSTTIIFN
jgi:queuine/archaeosine tRNA-ribosyltransferase